MAARASSLEPWAILHPLLPGPHPVELSEAEHGIGRHELATPRKLVSKQHLLIRRDGTGAATITDASVNGTWLNGTWLCEDQITLIPDRQVCWAGYFKRQTNTGIHDGHAKGDSFVCLQPSKALRAEMPEGRATISAPMALITPAAKPRLRLHHMLTVRRQPKSMDSGPSMRTSR